MLRKQATKSGEDSARGRKGNGVVYVTKGCPGRMPSTTRDRLSFADGDLHFRRARLLLQSVIDGIRIAPLDRRMGRKPLEQPRNWSGTVGRHWVRLRRKLFATQAEFAAALTRNGLKVTTPTVSEWERRFRMPNLSDLPAIAATLEVPVQSLIPSKAFLTKFCDSQN
jgi:DNA-binding transcriptional regulator YiaG